MRPRVLRVLVLPALLLGLVLPSTRAVAGRHRIVETVYVPSSLLLEPTSYYVPMSSVYYAPTVYTTTAAVVRPSYYLTSTAYILPTTYYAPTRYVVRSAFRRPLVSTSYYVPTATTYYLPTTTTLDLPVLTSTSATVDCCGSEIVSDVPAPETVIRESPPARVVKPAPAAPSGSGDTGPTTGAGGSEGEPPLNPNVLRSAPQKRPSDTPPPAVPATPVPPRPAAPAAPPAAATAPPATAPPVTPAPPQSSELPPPAEPAPPAELNPPAAPPAGAPAQPASPGGPAERHEVRRPAFGTVAPVRLVARSTLHGRVVSAVTGKPEAGVAVTVSDAVGRFKARTATTGADGQFTVVLPEGDWSVQVPKGPGSTESINRDITVASGLITDDNDQEVTSLTINR